MVRFVLLVGLWLTPEIVKASAFAFQTGSTSTGAGGPNTMGIPPRPTDLGLSYITDKNLTFNLNIMGLSVGRRHYEKWGGILELGGGLIVDANGAGFGPYSIFGFEFFRTKGGYSLTLEYAQSLGVTFQGRIISPYICRLGFIKWF